VPENSLSAFRAAVDAGAGIECDLRLSSDGVAMIFHDVTLERLCGLKLETESLDADRLAEMRLAGSEERIPRLADLLRIAGTKTPLLLELKKGFGPMKSLCEKVAEALAGHGGPVGVMSFEADAGQWFARRAPNVPRGLVIDRPRPRIREEMIASAQPNFVAVSVRSASEPWVAELRRSHMKVGSWTVRTQEQRQQVAVHADALIWEGDGRP
jgi:glycerophosphoryl diester phosphodiesterase